MKSPEYLPRIVIFAATLLIAASAFAAGTHEAVIYNFQPNTDASPNAGLVADRTGNLYGAAVPAGSGGIVFKLSPPTTKGASWTETTLFTFNGSSNGNLPQSSLILDSNSNLYGTTVEGGNGNCKLGGVVVGCGVVFKISRSGGSWQETVLYNFQGGRDGASPQVSPLVFDPAGNLYGITTNGGITSCAAGQGLGCGVVFKLTHPSGTGGSWTETVIHRFKGSDGAIPQGQLVLMGRVLYGTTAGGGAFGFGTVFKINTSGKEAVLHSFKGGADGSNNYPYGLNRDLGGNLYGFTYAGGNSNYGTVFELTPSSGGRWTETALYTFSGASDGGNPVGAPVLDSSGNLYGATQFGGNLADCLWTSQQDGCGVVFKLAPPRAMGGSWTESVLHAFTGSTSPQNPDGAFPPDGIIFGKRGSLYGVTRFGGTGVCEGFKGNFGCGVAFAVKP